jgi:hypothetical protein
MAILFMDGFDLYDTAADVVAAAWSRESLTQNLLDTTGGRYGGGCIYGTASGTNWIRGFTPVAPGGTVIVCWAYKHDGGGGSADEFFSLRTPTGSQLMRMTHNASGAITTHPQTGAALGTSSNVLTANTWVWVEVKIVLGTDATSGTITVHVNGSVVATYGSIDTNNGESASIIRLGGSNGNWYVDDVVIMDGTGSANNDFIGDSKIDTLYPNGEGSVMDWTYNIGSTGYEAVDESATADDDTSYIYATTAGTEARFTIANLSDVPDDIFAVQPRYRAKKQDVGTRTMRALINSSSSEATGPTVALTISYSWKWGGLFSTNPNGGGAWTTAAVNALQAGVEVVA